MRKTYSTFLVTGTVALSSIVVACGDEGSGTPADTSATATAPAPVQSSAPVASASVASTAGTAVPMEASVPAMAMSLVSFEEDDAGFLFQDYEPGDPTYTNLYFQCAENAPEVAVPDAIEPATDAAPAPVPAIGDGSVSLDASVALDGSITLDGSVPTTSVDAAPPVNDAGATNSCAVTTLEWVGEPGYDGEPGMLKWSAPYSDYNQNVDMQKNYADDMIQDWSGKLIKVRVKLPAEGDGFNPSPSAAGGGFLFVKTGADWTFGRGAWVGFTADQRGTWVEFSLEVDNPDDGETDPTQVRAFGIQIATGGPVADVEEKPTAGVFYVDEFTVEDAE